MNLTNFVTTYCIYPSSRSPKHEEESNISPNDLNHSANNVEPEVKEETGSTEVNVHNASEVKNDTKIEKPENSEKAEIIASDDDDVIDALKADANCVKDEDTKPSLTPVTES